MRNEEMKNQSDIQGNQNIVIQGVTDSTITLNIDGKTQEIQNELAELKALLEKQQIQTFQAAQSIFNIHEINEANFGYITGTKAFNEVLVKRVILAMQEYNLPAQRLLRKIQNNQATKEWERQSTYFRLANVVILNGFVGVLGTQLSKVLSIGKQDFTKRNQQEYIENCLLSGRRALQLLCFALLSKLWDYKKGKDLDFTADQSSVISDFFDNEFELGINGYSQLFTHLYAIFKTHQLDFPLSELTTFEPHLQTGSTFMETCNSLQAIKELLDKNEFSLLDCFEVEHELANILEILNFLVNYKMISIKEIGYDNVRNTAPRFLHTYIPLELDSMAQAKSKRLNYVSYPIHTDAILLFKEQYQKSINLFPFIIDKNALILEKESNKICLYSSKNIIDGSLNYQVLEDNQIENIRFTNTLKADADFNKLMMNKEDKEKIKLDNVYLQFQEAKRTILGAQDQDDLSDIFMEEDDY